LRSHEPNGTSNQVVFEPNVPQQVKLKFPQGRIVSGSYGEQMYYSLAPMGRAFLELPFRRTPGPAASLRA
jgi:hypothetical protein